MSGNSDKSLREALKKEFDKLSSNPPKELEKVLRALDEYGVYDLDDLKLMPEKDVEELDDIKTIQRRYLARYIKKVKEVSPSGLDKSLCEALRNEFAKLSSDRPHEFKKLLDALDEYGVYDLDDLKVMTEEDFEDVEALPFQRRALMLYMKKLNGKEGKEESDQSVDNQEIHYHGSVYIFKSPAHDNVLNPVYTTIKSNSSCKDVAVSEKPGFVG